MQTRDHSQNKYHNQNKNRGYRQDKDKDHRQKKHEIISKIRTKTISKAKSKSKNITGKVKFISAIHIVGVANTIKKTKGKDIITSGANNSKIKTNSKK